MIVDTSALVAVLRREPEADTYLELMDKRSCRMSAGSYLETSIVVDAFGNPMLSRQLDDLIRDVPIAIEEVTVEQANVARQAYRDYGKGSGHPAQLNFGDCFAYALARTARERLLFKGDDFTHTDLISALDSDQPT